MKNFGDDQCPDGASDRDPPDEAESANELATESQNDLSSNGRVKKEKNGSRRGRRSGKKARWQRARDLAQMKGGEPEQYLHDNSDDCDNGLWRLPSVRAYLARIGAEPRSLKTAWVVEQCGQYPRYKARIDISASGEVSAPEQYAPTEAEQAAIIEEAKELKLPQQILASNVPPPQLRNVAKENLFAFKTAAGEVIAWQERREKDGRRSFHFWTYYSDGNWRQMEPDDGLPLYGLETLKDFATVYVHEGAKAARAARNLPPDHPWHDELAQSAHIGWAGGAENPDRTDWEPLARARNIRRVIIVADNDDVGRRAVPRIARKLNVPTYMVQFTSEFPTRFDLADEFPCKMFANRKTTVSTNGRETEVCQYIGPSLTDCLQPATWLTTQVRTQQRGRPSYKLRKAAKGQWIYVKEIDKYACSDRPELRFKAEALGRMLAPFSDADPVPLIARDYSFQIESLCYRPDKAGCKIIATSDGAKLNIYRPSNVRAVKGDATPWFDFLTRLFPIETERKFMTQWCATLIARPDVFMKVAVLLISEMQGTGKSTLGKVLKPLVGAHNTSEPTASHVVESQYTEWVVAKRLVVVHEIYEGQSWKAYNRLKGYISEDTAEAHIKYETAFCVDNFANFILCSNSLEALKIDDADRRIFVPTVTEEKWDKKEAAAFYEWLDAGGVSIIKQWAADYGDYLPNHADVPITKLKTEIIDASKSAIVAYGEMIAQSMLRDAKPVAVAAQDVLNRAKELNPKVWAPSPLSFNRILAKTGLAYLRERIKWNGVRARLFLNPAGVREIEKRHDCVYSARDEAFHSKTDGAEIPVSKFPEFLREIMMALTDIESM